MTTLPPRTMRNLLAARFAWDVRIGVVMMSAFTVAACGPGAALPPTTSPAGETAPAAGTALVVIGTYVGMLPCADCRGINTTLTLLAQSRLDTGGGTFELSEEYVGTRDGNRTVQTGGRWVLLRGTPTDVDATVYQFNSDDLKRVMFYRRIGDETLRLLDREQRDIQSSANYTITRVTELPFGGYQPIDPMDGEARAAAEYAVSAQAARGGTALTLQRIVRAERQVVAGMNYRLCLEVTAGGQPQEARAIVFRNLQQRMSLTEWSTQGCR